MYLHELKTVVFAGNPYEPVPYAVYRSPHVRVADQALKVDIRKLEKVLKFKVLLLLRSAIFKGSLTYNN